MDTNDARKITVPHILLPSKDESQEQIAEYKAALEAKSLPVEVETYETRHHGWLAARSNLDDEEDSKEFERG
jgi:dienelactone hydrolase